MKLFSIPDRKYWLSTAVISAVVAILIHFPEIISLSDSTEAHELFPGMDIPDVINEVFFTFISLVVLFWINDSIFHFNEPEIRISKIKACCSFVLTWIMSSLIGKLFVIMHHTFDIPAIDAMVHNYMHPLRDLIMSSIVTGGSYIIHLVSKQHNMQMENQSLRTESIRNQYEALKSQLNPHMLFNSLNTLQSLIREDSQKAMHYTQELSRVLRYTLRSNGSGLSTLKEELDFADAYIFLMKMRYEENLSFTVEADSNLNECMLPTMSLQILIENAIKHNEISSSRPLSIKIATSKDGFLAVSNPIQPKITSGSGTGIGLENLSKRYQMLTHNDIEITDGNGTFRVCITLLNPGEK